MADFRQTKEEVTLFFITMNMHARSGTPTHMIVGSLPGVSTVEEFYREIEGKDFLLIEEFYRGNGGSGCVRDRDGSDYHSVGTILLNVMYIGKVKT